ncbi:MAG: T9SS type A sorting domain-containing protein, partial [Bacteroidales bacterium]|nr:T9SS type A sorting domain-containing protein [Bacteroidales bacterium]
DSRNQKSELRNLKFEILDICGKVLKTISIDNRSPGEQELVIDVSDLPAGMYFVRMEAEGKLGMRKLIVK